MTAGTFQVGARIEEFVLERALGQGGMGAVFEARHVETGARRALKVLLGRDAVARERFLREARALARIGRHPAIVGIDDVRESEAGEPYLVLELVEGTSLEARLARGPLPPDEVARIGRDVAGALACVHARGIVHRDLKPGNVLLRPDGSAVLTDFGVARDEAEARLTATQALVGTPEFMAPEQIAPGPRATIGPPTDVFALGALLWTMLAGRSPFQGDSIMHVVHLVTEAPVAPPRARPDDLDRVALWCLERDPAGRPRAEDVGAALARIAAGEPAGVPGAAWGPPRSAALVAALVVLSGGAIGALRALDAAPRLDAAAPVGPPAAQGPGPPPARAVSRERRLFDALRAADGPARVAAWREARAALLAAPEDPALADVRARLEALAARPLLVVADTAAGEHGRTWPTPIDAGRALLCSPEAGGARLLDLADGSTRPWILAAEPGQVPSAAAVVVERGGRRLALLACTAPGGGGVHPVLRVPLGDLAAPPAADQVEVLARPSECGLALGVAPDGRVGAAGAYPGVAIIDPEAPTPCWVQTPRARPTSRSRALTFSPDGRSFAVAGGDADDPGRTSGWVVVHAIDGLRAPLVLELPIIYGATYGRRGGLLGFGAHTLYLIDAETGQVRPDHDALAGAGPFGEGMIRGLDLAGDVAWTASQERLIAWRWTGGDELPVVAESRPRRGPDVALLRCTRDGALVLLGTGDPPTVEVWGGALPARSRR